MKLLVFPKDPNPYQDLLYRELSDRIDVKYMDIGQQNLVQFLTIMPRVLLALLWHRICGFRTIHIHWVYPMFVSSKVPFYQYISYVYILMFYAALKLLRFRIIWTVHDVVPQDPRTFDDEKLMQMLSVMAHEKLVHSSSVIKEMEAHGLDTNNVHLIPHGSYVGAYPDTITPVQARAKLGIRDDSFVILFFGIISPYKGVDKLLNAVSKIQAQNVRVVIAGKCVDDRLREQITEAAKHSNIDFYDGHVPDEMVEVYFKACNVVCLPFSVITTSGSTLLAFSFGKPVIAPRMGGLNDVPAEAGYFYNPADENALPASLQRAIDDTQTLSSRGQKAKKYADSISWDKIASKTYRVYQSLVRRAHVRT